MPFISTFARDRFDVYMLIYIRWDVDPVAFFMGKFPVMWYSLLFIVGTVICVWVLKRVYAREGFPWPQLQLLVMVTTISLFIGARLGHCLFYEPHYFLCHPLEIFLPVTKDATGNYVFSGYRGMASHGGALALVLALIFYARRLDIPFMAILDRLAIVLPLGACFIRLGNFINSEMLGFPTDLPWAVVFDRVDTIPRHPAQLYEAVSYLFVFLVNIVLYQRFRFRYRGLYWSLFLLLVFSARFLVEFVKERQVAFEDNFSLDLGQWLSVPFIVAGGICLWYTCKRKPLPAKDK